MEELKACPYSDAELKGAIDRMAIAANHKSPLYLWPIDCHVALWSLECSSHTAVPENKPLTFEQLQQMVGEPIYVVCPKSPEETEWRILNGIDSEPDEEMDTGVHFSDGVWERLEDYGKTWIAYAQPPERNTQ